MNKKTFILVIVSILILGTTVLVLTKSLPREQVEEKPEMPHDESLDSLGNITSFDDAVNAFSFDLFKQLLNNTEYSNNVFISPYSIFTALAMTYEGARGTTADEMRHVLNIEQQNDSFHHYVSNLSKYLNTNEEYTVSTANALWVKQHYPLIQDYLNLIYTYYGGNASAIDFSKPEQAASQINRWIEEKTQHLITDLIPPEIIHPLTVLILTNAIYFKGTWQIQFDEKNTTERIFIPHEGETIPVQTMRLTQTVDQFNYTESDLMQILELPYTGNDISMTIFLPKEGVTIPEICNILDQTVYNELINSMNQTQVDLYLPKFIIKTPLYTLNEDLQALGMLSAFTPGLADFSGMDGTKDLFIDNVLHKAYIEVNEEGTEAAGATAVVFSRISIGEDTQSERILFDANHPFLFLIQQKTTGTILFLGTMTNPIV